MTLSREFNESGLHGLGVEFAAVFQGHYAFSLLPLSCRRFCGTELNHLFSERDLDTLCRYSFARSTAAQHELHLFRGSSDSV